MVLGGLRRANMFEKMKEFVRELGKYSFSAMQRNRQIAYKEADEAILSIVTDVDLHNSRAFKQFAAENFSDLSYVIIDEESIDDFDGDLFERISDSEYQFIFDPIDGTLNYSSGLPFYGILLAVFKRGRPLYGFIYAPALDEFVYTDGKQVYREHQGEKAILNNFPKNISRVIQAHGWEIKLKPNHTKGGFIVEDYFSAAIYSLYLSLGQLRAAVAAANIWDIAPLMAIAKICGMGIYDYDSGEEIILSPDYISAKGRVKNMMIMGFKDEISEIKDVFADVIKSV